MHITKAQRNIIIEHAKREAPNEACGILAGTAGEKKEVKKIYQMKNNDRSAATFFMDPKEQLKVMKEIRNSGLSMIGIYHSHLESESYPSSHDVKLAFYPEASYVIVSIKDNPVIRSFKIVKGRIEEEKIVIT